MEGQTAPQNSVAPPTSPPDKIQDPTPIMVTCVGQNGQPTKVELTPEVREEMELWGA